MDKNFFCEFCKNTFNNNSNLTKHQRTAKFCLEIQNKTAINLFYCNICNKSFNRKDIQEEHSFNCKDNTKAVKKELNKALKTIENLNTQIEEYKLEIINLQKEKIELDKYKIYQSLYEKLENDYKQILIQQNKSLETVSLKAIENAGHKTINNTTNRNKIINNLLPLTDDYMREQTQFLTYTNVKNGIEGLAEFASNHTFKDRLYCSDVSRLNFIFKNENEEVIKDPEGIEITKRFIEINKEELLRLLEEYLNSILDRLFDPEIDRSEYEIYAKRREEIIATRNAVKKGNIAENIYSYNEFKKSFLMALSGLVAR